MKIVKFVLHKLLLLFIVLVVAEGLLRTINYFKHGSAQLATEAYFKTLNLRLYRAWLKPEQESPFLPPFQVYSDTGWDNPERLLKIYQTTELPKNQTWESHDFLQDEDRRDSTVYKITSNDLGFRGGSHKSEKKPGVIRVIALGDYHTFGHGVEDDQAYPAQLEKKLNTSPGKREFEVWNGGRHAATAIIGLARAKHEIFQYKPDVLILDYGFVDPLVWGDNFMPLLRLPDGFAAFKILIYPLLPIFAHSSLIQSLQNRFLLKYWRERSLGFQKTVEQILLLAAENKTPVILVRELESHFEDSVYEPLIQNHNVTVIDTKILLEKAMAAKTQTPDVAGTWMIEVAPEAHNEGPFKYWPYRLNYFQLNAAGHGLVADALSLEVERLLGK